MYTDNNRQGGAGIFPATLWQSIADLQKGPGYDRELLSILCLRYYGSVYSYIRRHWNKGEDEAQDLTQQFFAILLERNLFKRADRTRGRFRKFLKRALDNFMADEYKASKRQIRGGDTDKITLPQQEMDRLASKEVQYDSDQGVIQVAQAILKRVLRRLEVLYKNESRPEYFRTFKIYALDHQGQITYEEVAKSLKIDLLQVTNYLHHARMRLKGLVMEEIERLEKNGVKEELIGFFKLGLKSLYDKKL